MDLNSDYKGKPTLLWVAVLIVAVVGVWYLIQAVIFLGTDIPVPISEEIEGINTEALIDLLKSIMAAGFVILGVLTLLLAFLLYKGSDGGRTFTIIILIIAILLNVFGAVTLNLMSLVELLLAIVVLVILFRPNVRAYFKA
ncbi:MAG: hypothetical protein LBE47_03475 [Methanomassiliicoccaceae archaeon]|jgi:hypothetical protein|nr:hypothetical protein [Methanomassiliicoccaceae archaeon]